MQDPGAEMAAGASYAYKASLIGSAHRFELTEEGLSWHIGGRSGLWRYGEISAIRLSFRPVSMQQHRFRADVSHASGGRIAILSTSWQTAALMAPQDNGFRNFIVALHARMAQAGSRAELTAGLGRKTYATMLAFLAVLAVAMTGLLVRALAIGEFAGALFIIGFAALFAWQIGGFVRRNQPRSYSFDRLPRALLP
ncbi:hypothetical protein [Bradyrhizobium canariense]|uniref:Bll5862 protein n=1 Tax=Bradyrhizobium canariense TaxID=255045 RepID=A0A1X3GR01_9BRAD|nr:hypothetical protein [Bradyrhizobium canariense]OSI81687.1 hypothetical protein BSZ23_05555 [Bradyrhizobium canariense]OSI95444.1 hypothetical protein BSZ25_04335 [Bradyrhizobium canariense]OSI95726.1 hypothetical protein BSZ24_06890 [Bradyrhizobium canariense]OSJ10929.1 hypothetical protein BSZ16_05795 [Bradyrhizobium canariense]OSJ16459.1 hypothetical protein BSZ18_05835 [Bradyrhizobium canariense]